VFALDRFPEILGKAIAFVFGDPNRKYLEELVPTVRLVNEVEPRMRELSDPGIKEASDELRRRHREGGESLDDLLPEAFALVREAARRTVNMRPFDVQVMGGVVLHQGKIAEMMTGEGKTLVATLPAYLNSLAGRGVHVVTVNDYLARRDAGWMGPIYRALGLEVGAIQTDMYSNERIPIYRSDITYGTNNEFGFDYLRDNMKSDREDQCQKEHHYAIVDEVDSVLIDEARTPLIISGPAEEATDRYYTAARIARNLKKGEDYTVDEKHRTTPLTEAGMERAMALAGVGDFYTGKNMDWPHFIDNAIKAKELYKLDADYVATNGSIVIVDEFTGRLMPGRRWSDGLHQAIEAKENLKIKEENQTLATITLQNFFRLYKKHAGMTGTAKTEEREFVKIYNLDVIVIPPNKPLRRNALPDLIYGTAPEKSTAVVEEIVAFHSTGRPLLVGTTSIEKSERLSALIERRGIPHEVLNAKHHEREANIVAQAGGMGRVTIATNMAGRGTDIVLGSFSREELLEHWKKWNLAPKEAKASMKDEELEPMLTAHWAQVYLPEEVRTSASPGDYRRLLEEEWQLRGMAPLALCERVADLWGLHIVGTERHEARRIDNQLRGRTGRQGDPGSSRFFLSLEDDLMRIFASERVAKILRSLGLKEGLPLEHRMVTGAIERAQRKVEEHNFEIRKHLLEYDEVNNEQRKFIYQQRQAILAGQDLKEMILDMIAGSVEAAVGLNVNDDLPQAEWDYSGLIEWAKLRYGVELLKPELSGMPVDRIEEVVYQKIEAAYNRKEKEAGPEAMRVLERFLMLETIDKKWKDHLYGLDVLKEGIGLRGYGQKDPRIEYKREALEMFNEMVASIREEITGLIMRLHIAEADPESSSKWRVTQLIHGEADPLLRERAGRQAAAEAAGKEEKIRPIKADGKVGRNAPCPCGSGKKYKKCCGRMK